MSTAFIHDYESKVLIAGRDELLVSLEKIFVKIKMSNKHTTCREINFTDI